VKTARLILFLALFVPGFSLLGAFAARDNHERIPWLGLSIGALVGALFGLVLGGARGRWLDAILGPEDADGEQSHEDP
jgi:hypothetical protein